MSARTRAAAERERRQRNSSETYKAPALGRHRPRLLSSVWCRPWMGAGSLLCPPLTDTAGHPSTLHLPRVACVCLSSADVPAWPQPPAYGSANRVRPRHRGVKAPALPLACPGPSQATHGGAQKWCPRHRVRSSQQRRGWPQPLQQWGPQRLLLGLQGSLRPQAQMSRARRGLERPQASASGWRGALGCCLGWGSPRPCPGRREGAREVASAQEASAALTCGISGSLMSQRSGAPAPASSGIGP